MKGKQDYIKFITSSYVIGTDVFTSATLYYILKSKHYSSTYQKKKKKKRFFTLV